jgi:hypothetical protein
MHHWHTATVDTLTSAKPLQDVIRIAMPQEGLRYPLLMHSILAVARYTSPTLPWSIAGRDTLRQQCCITTNPSLYVPPL